MKEIELPPITVLPADDVKDIKIGWTVKEYMGFKIDGEIAKGIRAMITTMKDGDTLSVENYPNCTFTRYSENEGILDSSESSLYSISIDQDERQKVICSLIMNKKGLKDYQPKKLQDYPPGNI